MQEESLKTCSRCKLKKPLSDFGIQKRRNRSQYPRSICKPCGVIKAREWTTANPERRRLNVRRSAEGRRELHNQECRAYYARHSERRMQSLQDYWKRNPEKRAERHAVAYALVTGKLTRQPCAHCGAEGRVHAHHHDYSQPLDVTWLCSLCHGKEHRAAA